MYEQSEQNVSFIFLTRFLHFVYTMILTKNGSVNLTAKASFVFHLRKSSLDIINLRRTRIISRKLRRSRISGTEEVK